MQGFDRARPLGSSIVEGLAGSKAAMILKVHHSLSDGVGLVRMTSALVETSDEPTAVPRAMPRLPQGRVLTQPSGCGRFRARVASWARSCAPGGDGRPGRAGALVSDPGVGGRDARPRLVRGAAPATIRRAAQPSHAGAVAQPAVRHAEPSGERAPRGGEARAAHERRLRRRRRGGLFRYHAANDVDVSHLRITMPISVREGESGRIAGNQFVPARFIVPVDIADPVERMKAVHELVSRQRDEPALRLLDELAAVLNRLPPCCPRPLFGAMLRGVDFVASNVPGPRFEVWLAGAKVEGVVGFGPLAGAAANVTLFSYLHDAHFGITTDPAAVPDSSLFVQALREAFDELLGM